MCASVLRVEPFNGNFFRDQEAVFSIARDPRRRFDEMPICLRRFEPSPDKKPAENVNLAAMAACRAIRLVSGTCLPWRAPDRAQSMSPKSVLSGLQFAGAKFRIKGQTPNWRTRTQSGLQFATGAKIGWIFKYMHSTSRSHGRGSHENISDGLG